MQAWIGSRSEYMECVPAMAFHVQSLATPARLGRAISTVHLLTSAAVYLLLVLLSM